MSDNEKSLPGKTAATGLRALVVDDNKVNRMMLVLALQKHGCAIDISGNGKEAVEKMRAAIYDIVFMDCHMPEMDGFEATRIIRAAEKSDNRHTPVIAVTGDASADDRAQCLACGMDDYLGKPFSQAQVTGLLAKWATGTFTPAP